MKQEKSNVLKSSFRDPSGYVYREDDDIYRAINDSYSGDYRALIDSGLYSSLVEKGLLISHRETDKRPHGDVYKIIKPEVIPFISYPYEWSFSMLKDAALATLDVQLMSLEKDLCLKDASAYNIQFHKGRPILIDTLSFEKYAEGEPWVAYRQFCQHFLAPLALMSYKDIRLQGLLKNHIDGIPLDLAKELLPKISIINIRLFLHLHLHSRFNARYSDGNKKGKRAFLSKAALISIIEDLKMLIKGLKYTKKTSEWADYYQSNSYSSETFSIKKQIVAEYMSVCNAKTVCDLGANNGEFSRLFSESASLVVSLDIDPLVVEYNYLRCKQDRTTNIIPLLIDLANPSPALGWGNEERLQFKERGKTDLCLALALIHHLAIGNNLPFKMISSFLSEFCSWLIIEFVPKEDSQVQRLLSGRRDIFPEYTQEHFEKAFQLEYEIVLLRQIAGSGRSIYLMKKRTA